MDMILTSNTYEKGFRLDMDMHSHLDDKNSMKWEYDNS